MTRYASLIVRGERDNRVFMPGAGPNGGEFFLPWRQLRERFATCGVELNTPDRNAGRDVAFELHLNAQRHVPSDRPCYAYLYEDPLVRPLNNQPDQLRRYRKLFTWNEDQIDGERFLRLEYPNDLTLRDAPHFDDRDFFCVMLASNKALRHPSPRNLHDKRVEVIRFFEAEAPELFTLHGRGWHIPAVQPGALGRLTKRLNEWRAKWRPGSRPFPSWRGAVDRKADVLRRARFAICYENSRGSPGYLTEKIFDCFTSGCVPVYIGSPRGTDHIPPLCFIDGDQFASLREMLEALRNITREEFEARQRSMREFLTGPQSRRYTNEHWCDVLARTITQDLKLTS